MLFGRGKGPTMFALYFAVANPSERALLAARVSREILVKL